MEKSIDLVVAESIEIVLTESNVLTESIDFYVLHVTIMLSECLEAVDLRFFEQATRLQRSNPVNLYFVQLTYSFFF